MSLGASGSATASTGIKTSIGPVAFGSVNASVGSSTPGWVWPVVMAAAAAVVALLFFRRH